MVQIWVIAVCMRILDLAPIGKLLQLMVGFQRTFHYMLLELLSFYWLLPLRQLSGFLDQVSSNSLAVSLTVCT